MHDSKEFAELESLANNLPSKFGDYIYDKMIGKGGFSRVFLARNSNFSHHLFCAKVLPCSSGAIIQNAFDTESKLLAALDHPNILHLYDSFVERQMCHLIIEHCPNGSIRRLIKQGKFESHDDLIWYMRQIIAALAFCHSKHIVHRDIKPENILIDSYGRPKLSDFGISKSVEPGTLIGIRSGSQVYMAPEVNRDQEHDPYAADVWSLGVTFYYMAVGHLPWSKNDEKAMRAALEQGNFSIPKNVHHEVSSLICKMLRVEPEERPTMQSLLELDMFRVSGTAQKTPKVNKGVLAQVSPLLKPSATSSYFVLRHNSGRDGGARVQLPGVRIEMGTDIYKTTEHTTESNMFII